MSDVDILSGLWRRERPDLDLRILAEDPPYPSLDTGVDAVAASTGALLDGLPPGRGGRTHLVSPEVAAATAIAGRFAAPADLQEL